MASCVQSGDASSLAAGPYLVLCFWGRGHWRIQGDTIVEEVPVDRCGEEGPAESLLRRIDAIGIKYKLVYGTDCEYIFCILSIPEDIAKRCAAQTEYVQLPLDAWEVFQLCRQTKMPMAERTPLSCFPEELVREKQSLPAGVSQGPLHEETTAGSLVVERFLDASVWENLYAPYSPSKVVDDVYQQFKASNGSKTLFPPSRRARLLYDLLAEPSPNHGSFGIGWDADDEAEPPCCNCMARTAENFFGKGINDQSVLAKPYYVFFVRMDPRDEGWIRLRRKCMPTAYSMKQEFQGEDGKLEAQEVSQGFAASFKNFFSRLVDDSLPDDIEKYLGTDMSFYFSFVQHFFKWSLVYVGLQSPLLIVWAALAEDWSRQPVLWCLTGIWNLIWSQLVIQMWRRKEWRLRLRWGLGIEPIHLQPRFQGVVRVSAATGRLQREHVSKRRYKVRVVLINAIFLLATVIIGCAILLVDVSSRESVGEEESNEENIPPFFLGVCWMLALEILGAIYEEIDGAATNAENHRLSEAYQNSHMFKRWTFYFTTHFGLIVYLAILKPLMVPCSYGTPNDRAEFGVYTCSRSDSACCDASSEYVTFRDRLIVNETALFLEGWLFARIFGQNIAEWISPRFFGFLCARGIYPCVICDFLTDFKRHCCQKRSRTRTQRRGPERCCPGRRKPSKKVEERSSSPVHVFSQVSPQQESHEPWIEDIIHLSEQDMDRQVYWKVHDNTKELVLQFLMMNVCVVIVPLASVLFAVNLMFEFHGDLYRLFDRRLPVPGCGTSLNKTWLSALQIIVHFSIATNATLIAFRTTLPEDIAGSEGKQWKFRMFLCLSWFIVLSALTQFIDYIVDDMPSDVSEHLIRQRRIFSHLSQFGRKFGDLSDITLGAIKCSLRQFQPEPTSMPIVGWQELTKWHSSLSELMPTFPVVQQNEAHRLLKDLDQALDGAVPDGGDKKKV